MSTCHSMNSAFCHGPFVRAFVLPDGTFRNCCSTIPEIRSKDCNFENWWFNDKKFNDFRGFLQNNNTFHNSCYDCEISEKNSKQSFRIALNKIPASFTLSYPKEWSIMAGNICNLACWHCSEDFSSRIEAEKKLLKILPESYQSPQKKFKENWPYLTEKILQSYDFHDTVYLSFLGGEPSYNEFVLKFLNLLDEKKLSHRTKLEITTNATASTKFNEVIANTNWQHVAVMISIDAIGEKAEWLRYGCKWDQVDNNINFYAKTANYVELHFTLHMLNIDDLLEVYDYSQSKNIPMIINYLQTPNFLSLKHWDGPAINLIKNNYESRGLVEYLHTIGSDPIQGSFDQLKNYIKKFSGTRKSPENINSNLAILFE